MHDKNSIKCPHCGEEIDVQSIVYQQIKAQLLQESKAAKKNFDAEVAQKREEYKQAFEKLDQAKAQMQYEKAQFQQSVQKATQDALEKEKEKLTHLLKENLNKEYKDAMDTLMADLNQKTEQIKELNLAKIEIEQLKREKDAVILETKVKVQSALREEMQKENMEYKKNLEEENRLKLKEKDVQLENMKQELKALQRKVEIGSQQLQGEVQELAIEEYLKEQFPFDSIEEIKKGVRGGDCIQIINTRELAHCGKIYYESKRTKDFQQAWIAKFKEDMRQKGVDVGVIVTETMPKEMEHMGLYEGIWLCTFKEFKALVAILRESVIRVYLAKKSQENKQDKMQLLYNYLTSAQFQMQIEAIVEGFIQMQNELESEKRAMQNIWKKREKQIAKVLDNAIAMHGAMQGIAGNTIGNIRALELENITSSDS